MSAEVGAVKYRVELDDSNIDQETKKSESKIAAGFKSAAGAVSSTVSTALKVGTAAVAAASTAVAGLVKTATSAYADYEQLVGGSKLMFGDAYDFIADKAANAFKTVQMSTNDYLQQVNGLATGLKTALGGNAQAAAELADKVITAEANVVAATGASQEAVQNAFNGIMKSNFTMLDNLQIGIKPTKEGFQEVIDKVNEWNAANGKATKYQIDNLADCQAALVDYIEMQGMAEYAANEAADTLQGSLSMVQAAWTNLTAGLADPDADLGKLIGDMVDSAQAFLNNLIPVIKQALTSITQAIGEAAPVISDTLIPMLVDLAPELISAGVQLAGALMQGLVDSAPDIAFAAFDIIEMLLDSMLEATESEGPGAITEIITWILGIFEENYVGLLDTGMQIIENILNGMSEALPEILSWLPMIVEQMAGIIIENAPMLLESAAELILTLALGLAEMIPELIPTIVEVVMAIAEALTDPNNLMMLLDAALAIILALAEGLIKALPKLLEKAPVIISNLAKALADGNVKIVKCALDLILALAQGILDGLDKIFEAGGKLIDEVVRAVKEGWEKAKESGLQLVEHIKEGIEQLNPIEWGKDLIDGFISGLKQKWEDLKQTVSDIADSIKERLGFSEPEVGPLSDFHTYAPDMMDLYAKGIHDNAYKVEDAVEGLAGDMAMGFESDINYNVPDLAGYAADLSAAITGAGSSRIEVPVILNGREIARASAVYMGEQLAWEAR